MQAQAIVKEIDCAIGMSAPIGDDNAIAFAAEFYQALGFEKSVQDAYDLGVVRLLGEGVADAKTLVKLHKRRGVKPAQIVLVGTHPEPQTPGGPERPADQETPTPAAGNIEAEIRDMLRPLMGDRDSRRARLTRAFAAYPGLLNRIGVDGDTGVFLDLMLNTLREYGEVEAGKPAVCVLLEVIRSEVGVRDKERIDEILRVYPR